MSVHDFSDTNREQRHLLARSYRTRAVSGLLLSLVLLVVLLLVGRDGQSWWPWLLGVVAAACTGYAGLRSLLRWRAVDRLD